MEHPLINDLNELSVDELGAKVSELQNKLGFAMKMGNGQLCHQIRMALESYQNKYQEKLKKQYEKDSANINNIAKDKISIS